MSSAPVRERITEDWLAKVGFKWHPVERSGKHWLLWLNTDGIGPDDLGIELTSQREGAWFCWLRADYAGRYTRFLHVRYLTYTDEVTTLFEGLTGQAWNPENNWYGIARTPKQAERLREEYDRLDRKIAREMPHRAHDLPDGTEAGPQIHEARKVRYPELPK